MRVGLGREKKIKAYDELDWGTDETVGQVGIGLVFGEGR